MTHEIDFLQELEDHLRLVATREERRGRRYRQSPLLQRPRIAIVLVVATAAVGVLSVIWADHAASPSRAVPLAASVSVHRANPLNGDPLVRFGFGDGSSILFATCSTTSCSRTARGDFGIQPSRRTCSSINDAHSTNWSCTRSKGTS